jgi:TonB family protein
MKLIPTLTALILSVGASAAIDAPSSPRLQDGRFNAPIPRAFGGGEVVVELTVDSAGGVADIARVRTTPPYLDYVVDAVGKWRFAPATALTDGRVTAVAAPVLVVAVFRPPLVYAGPAPGARSQLLGAVSRRSPGVASVTLPAYPPTAIGDGIVIVEIEMTRQAEPRDYRIVGAASGFDNAALAAVRTWRFAPPQDSKVPEPIFAYAVLGFREPLTLPAPKPR